MRRSLMTAVVAGIALASAGAMAASAAPAGQRTVAAHARPDAGPVPAGFEPISVTFVSASHGWVLGTAPCAHAPCTSVVRTTDGGRTWAGVPAPRYRLENFSPQGLSRMRFADTANGFAFGSQLWVTHDGAAHWHRVLQVPGSIVDLEASAGQVYAASERFGRLTIYRSPASRDAWHRVAALPSVSGDGGPGTITLHGTAAWILMGAHIYASQTGSGWVRENFQCLRNWGIASLAAYNSRRLTVLCAGEAGLGSTQKLLYASANGGAHFTRVGAVPSGGDGGLLAEPTPQHLLVATSSGATWLYVSSDGGRRWHKALNLDDGGKGWSDFGFTTAEQGVAVEGAPQIGSHLYMTRNAGGSWHLVRF
jgi:photosystem II stability/assembly factor-like uncharacterized protein